MAGQGVWQVGVARRKLQGERDKGNQEVWPVGVAEHPEVLVGVAETLIRRLAVLY